MFPNCFAQERVVDVVERLLDRLPTTTAIILMAIPTKYPSFGRVIPLRDRRLMYLVGAIAAASSI